MVAQSQHPPHAPQAGKVIATLESRRAQELSSLISRHGGTPFSAPALREVTLDNREDVRTFIERLIAGDVSMIIFLRDALIALGAELLEVSLYRWELPEDQGPLTRFLEDVQRGSIDVVAATSQAQVRNLFTLAEHFGQGQALQDALNHTVIVAAVGPVAARAWRERGVTTKIVPEHPKMGHLILAIAEHFHGRQAGEAPPAP